MSRGHRQIPVLLPTSPLASPPIKQVDSNKTNSLESWAALRAWEILPPCFKESTLFGTEISPHSPWSFHKCHKSPILFGMDYFHDWKSLQKCIFTNLREIELPGMGTSVF